MENESEATGLESEQNATLEALREAELRYRTVADFTYDWEYWETPDGRLRYVSPSCERITGYPAERFLNNPEFLIELILPEDRAAWIAHRHGTERSQKPEVQFRIQHRDGGIRWIEHACRLVMDGQGALLGYRASNRDVTGRKQVEAELQRYREQLEDLVAERTAELASANESLRQEIAERKRAEEARTRSEERYALAQRAAGIGSWDWNTQTGKVHWSEEIEPMFGFEPGTFGSTYEEFLACIHPEDRKYVVDSVRASVQSGNEYAIEHRIIWPDGTVRWILETGDVIRDASGNATRMIGISQDITARKEVEQALREAVEATEAARFEEQERRQEAERRRRIAESLGDVLAVLNSNQSLDVSAQ